MKLKWISRKKRMPEDGYVVMGLFSKPDPVHGKMLLATWVSQVHFDGEWGTCSQGYTRPIEKIEFTHWFPFPHKLKE